MRSFEIMAARFPYPYTAPSLDAPLAYGGDLEIPTLLAAYSKGYFPWYNEGDPILWWSPDPRFVLLPENFKVSRRSGRAIANKPFTITFNAAFGDIIRHCAAPRPGSGGTWITKDIFSAYSTLHKAGYAHSVETWIDGELAGGIYGVALGKAFFGESMFHLVPEAGRAALAALVRLLQQEGFLFLDCQQESPHMAAMGAEPMPRPKFINLLRTSLAVSDAGADGICPWRPWTKKYTFSRRDNSWS